MDRVKIKHDVEFITYYVSKDNILEPEDTHFSNQTLNLTELTADEIWEKLTNWGHFSTTLTIEKADIENWLEADAFDNVHLMIASEESANDSANEEHTAIALIEIDNAERLIADAKTAIDYLENSNEPEKETLINIIKDLSKEHQHKINYKKYLEDFNKKHNTNYEAQFSGKPVT